VQAIFAVDPGTVESGFCLLEQGQPTVTGTRYNGEIVQMLRNLQNSSEKSKIVLAIEQMQSYGGPVSTDVFQTLIWSGRLQEAGENSGLQVVYLPRVRVKTHLCNKPNATDAEVWAAVCKRYGVAYERGKRAPAGSVLHGIAGDARQALALALLLYDEQNERQKGGFFTVGQR